MYATRKLLFLLFLFGGGIVAAGQSTLGSISGAVHDPQGALVPNATVQLHRQQSDTDRTVTTGADGQYTAVNLDPGTYNLTVTAQSARDLGYDVTVNVLNAGEHE